MWTRRLLVTVLVLALAACGSDDDSDDSSATPTTVGAPTTSTGSAGTSTIDCPTVGFTPQSEDAASSVKATGVTCQEAEAFLRVAGPRTSSGGPSTLQVEGYRCVLTEQAEDPLPQATYECENGAKRISFVRT